MSKPIGYGIEEPPNRNGAFPRLNAEQRALLRGLGTTRQVHSGEVLFREGDAPYDFFIVESGAVAIVQGYGVDNRVIAIHGAHRFLGELNLLTGSPAQLSAVVRDPGEVIQVTVGPLRKLVAEKEELSNLILPAFLARRSILIDSGAGVKLVGSRYSRETRALREFLARNRMPYQWVDLEDDNDAAEFLARGRRHACGDARGAGAAEVLRNPSNAELAGCSASARAARRPRCATWSSSAAVRPASPPPCTAPPRGSTPRRSTRSRSAARRAPRSRSRTTSASPPASPAASSPSARILQAAQVRRAAGGAGRGPALVREDGHYAITLSDGNGRQRPHGDRGHRRALPQARRARLEAFEGLGVYYAATHRPKRRCAPGARDHRRRRQLGRPGGDVPVPAAGSCRLLIRGGDLAKSMSRYLINEIEQQRAVEVMTHTEVVALHGNRRLESAVVRDTRTGSAASSTRKAVFVFIGASPHTEWLGGQVAMDEHGFLLTGRDLQDDQLSAFDDDRPLFLETSKPRHLRRRRRPRRLGQARRLGGRRGLDGGAAGAPAAGRRDPGLGQAPG